MKLFSRGCASRQLPYLAAVGRLGIGERLDLEAHAATCPECADALRNAAAIDVALRGAFAPLRERRATLAPGRVRLALGPRATKQSVWLRAPRFFGRLAEVSVMLGVTLFSVGTSLEPVTPEAAPPSEIRSVTEDYFRAQPPFNDIDYFRWLRLVRADANTLRDPARLPAGGRFDVEPPEITRSFAAPR